jgi:hypothetical protein
MYMPRVDWQGRVCGGLHRAKSRGCWAKNDRGPGWRNWQTQRTLKNLTQVWKAQDNVAVGEAEIKQMLPLMVQDKGWQGLQAGVHEVYGNRIRPARWEKRGNLEIRELRRPLAPQIRSFHK